MKLTLCGAKCGIAIYLVNIDSDNGFLYELKPLTLQIFPYHERDSKAFITG